LRSPTGEINGAAPADRLDLAAMRIFLGILGFLLGGAVGTGIGVGVGLAANEVFKVSCFEGLCGYVVAFIYAPLGLLIGGILGAILLAKLARRRV
jgi:hypothetical protein